MSHSLLRSDYSTFDCPVKLAKKLACVSVCLKYGDAERERKREMSIAVYFGPRQMDGNSEERRSLFLAYCF